MARELPPYVSKHNLAKPPKLAKPLPLGDDVEALHGGSHKSRRDRYRKAIRILERLIVDDRALELRVREAAKGSSSVAEHSAAPPDVSGTYSVSDPTGNAATAGRIKDPAQRAWDSADTAMKALWWANTHRERALRMTSGEGVLAELKPDEELTETGCTNCGKIGEYSKRGEPPSTPKDCELCVWCYQFQRAHNGVLPTRSLLRIHHGPKGKVTTRDVTKALRDSQPHNPHA